MRRSIVAIVLVVAACKGGKNKPSPEQAAAVKSAAVLPKVAVATVLAKADGVPPYLLLFDDAGQVRVGAAASWEALDANKLKITKKAMPLDPVDRHLREDFAMGKNPLETIASLDQFADDPIAIDLSDLEDTTRNNPTMQDDPPPPEEEDKPDDGADESGGTGTAMALEEGKMGKIDSDRAEGQYKMQKNQDDPQLARQQAIEQARAAGILGSKGGGAGFTGVDLGPNEDGTPSRLAQVIGVVAEDGKLERLRAMIFMAPTAKATKLIDVVRETGAAIAVSHEGKIRPLRLQLDRRDGSESDYWMEARVSAKGIVIEAVPDAPIELATLDPKELAAAIEKARTTRGSADHLPVDVLVDADVDVQRMIDVVVALDVAGVRIIGMGAAPSADELSRRGKRIPRTTIGQPNAQGDLDKAVIRRVVKSNLGKVHACYTTALAENATLAGIVQVQFFITPAGKVASSTASGVDPKLATCVGDAIKTFEFPKPKGGGGVQVNYPFAFRP